MAKHDVDIGRILELVEPEYQVDAMWLFGSYAQGVAREDSDIDIGVMFSAPITSESLLALRIKLQTSLGQEVDLIDMRKASPVLAMQVVRRGLLVVNNNEKQVNEFLTHLPSRYEDVYIARREMQKNLEQRLRS